MIEQFLAGLAALSKETGIYIAGTVKYVDFSREDYRLKPKMEAYESRDVIEVWMGSHTCRDTSGDFIVANIERVEKPSVPVVQPSGKAPMVVSDIEPYISATGEQVGGRRQHREFLKKNNLVEVGNEKKAFEKAVKDARAPQRCTPQEIADSLRQQGAI